MRTKLISLTLALVLSAGIAACGEDDEPSSGGGAEATTTPTPTETASEAGVEAIVQAIGKDTKAKPEIPAPQGDPPPELVIRDIVKGTGPKAKAGDELSMQYVGTSWSTGEQFDASWDRGGQPFPLQLGAGMVIQGWDQGLVGLRKGGRRLLIIPPDLGYGPQANGPIAANETLIFVVDRVS
jgi:FKBP-type peptidyl-prolyl cis-trans isomerase